MKPLKYDQVMNLTKYSKKSDAKAFFLSLKICTVGDFEQENDEILLE